MRYPWTCLWLLSWTCKFYLFECLLGCAIATFGVRASRSSTDEFVKKEYLLNKNIVHLIDYIFWHMPYKNPACADRVIMLILLIMPIIRIMLIFHFMVLYQLCVLWQLFSLYVLW
jgi:hypothetical protein